MTARIGSIPPKMGRRALHMLGPLIGTLCVTTAAVAHHSRALYDTTQEVMIDGTVVTIG